MQITINGNSRDFEPTEMSVAALVLVLDLIGKRIAIEHNGEILPRSQFDYVMLKNGDQLEIVGAVGGG